MKLNACIIPVRYRISCPNRKFNLITTISDTHDTAKQRLLIIRKGFLGLIHKGILKMLSNDICPYYNCIMYYLKPYKSSYFAKQAIRRAKSALKEIDGIFRLCRKDENYANGCLEREMYQRKDEINYPVCFACLFIYYHTTDTEWSKLTGLACLDSEEYAAKTELRKHLVKTLKTMQDSLTPLLMTVFHFDINNIREE